MLASVVLGGEIQTLQWQESGLTAKTGGMRPKILALSDTAPDGLKKAPDGVDAPRYAVLEFGPQNHRTSAIIALVEKDGKPSRLFADANGNGDLTDDPACDWAAKASHDPDGGDAMSYECGTLMTIPFTTRPQRGMVRFFCTRAPGSKYDDGFRRSIACYADYGLVGEVKIGDRTIGAALQDSGLCGEFRLDGEVLSTPIFWLALPGGPRGRVGQSFLSNRPFQVDGNWWALANMTADGKFEVVASAKPADEGKRPARPERPDLTGKRAGPFAAPLLGGGEVKFPGDYHGKIVLLDFWATWCGPCVAELPNVVNAYEKFHDRGFEVLGISFDKEGMEPKLQEFTKKKNMPWPQVYDGKFWNAAVGKLYGIHSIPRMMLVDGDTGTILDDDSLRGEALAPAIEKALKGKGK